MVLEEMVAYYQPGEKRLPLATQWSLSDEIIAKIYLKILEMDTK